MYFFIANGLTFLISNLSRVYIGAVELFIYECGWRLNLASYHWLAHRRCVEANAIHEAILMGVISQVKRIVTDYDDLREAEANHKESIERAEQEAYELEKKRRKAIDEVEAKTRKSNARKKVLDEARQRGRERAKPLDQKLDEKIAKAGTAAHRMAKTGGQVMDVAIDAGGAVAKQALKAPREIATEMHRIERQTAPKRVRVTRRVKQPNTQVQKMQKQLACERKAMQAQLAAMQRQMAAQNAPTSVVVPEVPATVTQPIRTLGMPFREHPFLGMPVRESPLATRGRGYPSSYGSKPVLASGNRGYPMSNGRNTTLAPGNRELPFSKKPSGKRFATR